MADYGRQISPGGPASLGNIAQSRAHAAPTYGAAPTTVNPVSAAVIERLTGVKLPTTTTPYYDGYHSRS